MSAFKRDIGKLRYSRRQVSSKVCSLEPTCQEKLLKEEEVFTLKKKSLRDDIILVFRYLKSTIMLCPPQNLTQGMESLGS